MVRIDSVQLWPFKAVGVAMEVIPCVRRALEIYPQVCAQRERLITIPKCVRRVFGIISQVCAQGV